MKIIEAAFCRRSCGKELEKQVRVFDLIPNEDYEYVTLKEQKRFEMTTKM